MARMDNVSHMPVSPQSLKIVHIITRFIPGGADENTLLSANWFAERGHDVTLVYGNEADPRILGKLHPAVQRIQVMPLCRPVHPLKDLAALFRIRRLLARLKPDILHTHTSKAGFIARLATLGLPRMAVIHGIHILPFVNVSFAERLVYTAMERSVAPLTDAFVSVSEGMRQTALAQGIGREERHSVVPSGMDIARFREAAAAAPPRAPGAPVEVLLLAAYEPRKQHLPLLEYIARQKDRFAGKLRFAFAGHGHMREECRDFVTAHGLEGIVEPEDFAADPAARIAAADICLYCSTNEGLPRAVVQYAAAGKPIVALDLPGLDVVVKQGRNGYLCPQGGFEGLCTRLLELAEDAARRNEMAAASSALDLSSWSVEHMCEQLDGIYEQALAKHR